MIFQRSLNVPVLSDPLDYRDLYLRPDFQFCCAYCLTHERYFLDGEAGQVDHHRPLHPSGALGLDFSNLFSVYSNLYWSCSKCNSCKWNHWPTNIQYAAGIRFLDPCVEDHDDHWDTHPDGTITAKTLTGRYSIETIRLDRRQLNERRAEEYQNKMKYAAILQELEQTDLTPAHRQTLRGWLADVEPSINLLIRFVAP